MKTIYLVVWEKINWSTYYTIGYNYVLGSGRFCVESKEDIEKYLPITKEEGNWIVSEITYFEKNK